MSDTLKQIYDWVQHLYSMPVALLIALACLALGSVLKRSEKFPNQYIPAAIFLVSGLLSIYLSPPRPLDMTVWQWRVKNALVGVAIASFVWAYHAWLWKWLKSKVPMLQSLFPGDNGGETGQQPPPDKPAGQ